MEKIKQIWSKYKIYILSGLLFIFFFRSCQKSTQIKKLDRTSTESVGVVDSLNIIISSQQIKINKFPETLRKEKVKIHSKYDNYISERDRGNQLMELHMVVKSNLKDLKK